MTKSAALHVALLVVLVWVASCATTHQISSGNTNLCINVIRHGYVVEGTPLIVKQCDPWQNQQWSLRNGQFTGVDGMCADVQGSAAVDGAPIIAVNCNGRPSEYWNYSNGQLVGIGGKCIDIGGGEPTDRAPLILATCSSAPSQQWQIH
jgi:hypothetical protein